MYRLKVKPCQSNVVPFADFLFWDFTFQDLELNHIMLCFGLYKQALVYWADLVLMNSSGPRALLQYAAGINTWGVLLLSPCKPSSPRSGLLESAPRHNHAVLWGTLAGLPCPLC